jgi:hypothetical protein
MSIEPLTSHLITSPINEYCAPLHYYEYYSTVQYCTNEIQSNKSPNMLSVFLYCVMDHWLVSNPSNQYPISG